MLARFGLMHVASTNICVWIRTLVIESLKEITNYHLKRGIKSEDSEFEKAFGQHTLRNAGMILGTELGPGKLVNLFYWSQFNLSIIHFSTCLQSRYRMGTN